MVITNSTYYCPVVQPNLYCPIHQTSLAVREKPFLEIITNKICNLIWGNDDIRDVREMVAENPQNLYWASKRLQDDTRIVHRAVARDGMALQYASERLKRDAQTVLIAAAQNINALQLAPISVLANNKQAFVNQIIDRAFVRIKAAYVEELYLKEYVQEFSTLLRRAIPHDEVVTQRLIGYGIKEIVGERVASAFSPHIASQFCTTLAEVIKIHEKEFKAGITKGEDILDILQRLYKKEWKKMFLGHASVAYRQGKSIKEMPDDDMTVFYAVSIKGTLLEHASARLRNDSTIVQAAVEQNGNAIRFANKRFLQDKKLVALAIAKNPEIAYYAYSE